MHNLLSYHEKVNVIKYSIRTDIQKKFFVVNSSIACALIFMKTIKICSNYIIKHFVIYSQIISYLNVFKELCISLYRSKAISIKIIIIKS